MAKMRKSSDTIQFESLSKLLSASIPSPSCESLCLIAHGLSSALNLCIKRIDKTTISDPPPACPKCNSHDVRIHGKTRVSLYCPICFRTFPSSTKLRFCPDCVSKSRLAESAAVKIRYLCKNCKTTYIEGVGVPTDFNKFIYFGHLVYNTELSYSEIIDRLKISSDTYYRWKKRLAIYFPNTRAYLYEKRGKK